MRWWDSRLIHEPTASADAVSCFGPRGERSSALERAVSATVGDRFTTTASAEVVGSWIRRLSHHRMVPCDLWDAQTPARRPHRRVWSLRCEVELHARRGGRRRRESDRGGAVTVTTSAEAVVSSIRRLFHHRMMSGNVCDGLELVRRPHNGRESMRSLF